MTYPRLSGEIELSADVMGRPNLQVPCGFNPVQFLYASSRFSILYSEAAELFTTITYRLVCLYNSYLTAFEMCLSNVFDDFQKYLYTVECMIYGYLCVSVCGGVLGMLW